MPGPSRADIERLLLRRAELERAFGIEEVLLPPPGSAGARPGGETGPPPGAPEAAAAQGEISPLPPRGGGQGGGARRKGRQKPSPPPSPVKGEGTGGGGDPRPAAAAEPVIVVGSSAAETMDLFDSDEDDFGERVPRVHSEGLPPAEALARLEEWTRGCRRCPLAGTRTNVVFGEGSPEARLVFVGEAPGADEDATGRPFVGRAGQLLDKIIAAMGLERGDVYICNVLKCRPPGNRTPGTAEVAACSPILRETLRVLGAEVIVALGSPATRTLLETNEGISKLRGRFHVYHGVPLMPTFHPAYLLRNPGEQYKRMVWEDMKAALARLGLEPPRRRPR